jgi:Tol biopolymer transport system component
VPGGEWRALGIGLLTLGATLFGAGLALAEAEDRHSPLLQLTVDRAQDVRAVWSPDGNRIAFQSDRGTGQYQIWSMQSDGGDQHQLSHDEADDRHPVYSPDGRQIAFDAGTANLREIWVMNADGSNRHQVTKLDAFASFPSWSADGGRLAFYLYQSGATDLYVVNADGASAQQLTSGLADERKSNCTNACHRPGWSPDGHTIAISGGDHRTVWTVDVNTLAMTQITEGVEHTHFPWYLSDGRLAWVVEYIQQGGAAFTDVVAVDAPHPTVTSKLLSNVSVQGPYELSPDGQRVLFHSPRSGNFDVYVADTAVTGGLQALQTSRATADIASGVPTPAPDPSGGSSRGVLPIDPGGSASAASHPLPQTSAAAAQPTAEPPPNPLLTMAITVLLMLGGATVIVTGVQLARRLRHR